MPPKSGSSGTRGNSAGTNEENDGSILRSHRHRKIYSFTPTTTTAFAKHRSSTPNSKTDSHKVSASAKKPIVELDPNVVVPIKVPKKTPRKRANPDQNTEDHVFWEMTPNTSGSKRRTFHGKLLKEVPSSPLVEQKNDADPLIPFLKKYNTTLDNLTSQTPDSARHRRERRSSDPESAEQSRIMQETSPSLQRTKSSGVLPAGRSASNPLIASGMSASATPSHKDINRLLEAIGNSFKQGEDPESTPTVGLNKDNDLDADFLDEEMSSELDNISMVIEKAKQPLPKHTETHEFLGDEFSDDIDMDELDNIVVQQVSSKQTVEKRDAPESLETLAEENTFGSDDFLDDGLDGLVIEITQKPVEVKAAGTQELLRLDRTNAALFKKEQPRAAFTGDNQKSLTKGETVNRAKSAIKKQNFHRFQIVEILPCKYTKNGRTVPQKILTVLDASSTRRKVIVRDLWENLEFSINDVIHIVGADPRIVDATTNLLIWNPDVMLSATAVGDALICQRKAILNSRLSFPGDCSVPLIVGNIVHTLFQECLAKGDCTSGFISELMESQLQANLINILSINETKESVKEEIVKHVPYIQTWFTNFVTNTPKTSIPSQGSDRNSLVGITKALDVEEYIWSPMYGIRGLIDVTVESYIKDNEFDGRFVTPLEIKTGAREQLQHRAQTSLYTLLVQERYNVDSKFFLLLYSKLKEMKKHTINPVDLRLLINIRNKMSMYLKEESRKLPPLLQQSKCDQCFALTACMTMNNLMEDGKPEDAKLKEGLYESIVKEIDGSQVYKDFFNHWDTLISKEETVINALKKELWTKTAREREVSGGKAIGNLKIVESQEEKSGFLYTLERVVASVDDKDSLQNSQLSKYDRVIISDESGHFALSSGWVIAIRPSFITVRTDRRIINSFVKLPDFREKNNQRFRSVLESSDDIEELIMTQSKTRTYRIDKDEMFHGLALARYNVLNLFLPHVGDSLRRRLLVDCKPPRFADRPLPHELPGDVKFNSDQQNAFDKVLRTKDYSLILGMPGTGKTTAIAQIIRFLVGNGMSVLLASYTHSAVDNILIKLLDNDISILRAGYASKVHPLVKKFVPNSGVDGSINVTDMDSFKAAYIDTQVVATTCLGINDVVFNHRQNFDYCIIDEASQVSMPVCLGPLRFCDKFILVGDHYQLPPLVISPEAKSGGLDKSLFKTLSDSFPESVVDLSYQYRMCADIMLLSNTLVYEGRLKCGTEEVANQKLVVPHPEKLASLLKDSSQGQGDWLQRVFEPNNRVLFLNHDEMPAFETVIGEKVQNATEAELVRQVVQSLIHCGVEERSIGVMSLYRAQLRLLHRKLSVCKEVEILTADQFQGRDKDCVVISMVRSNDHNSVGDLLKEWRRINVAITRARSKLVILGSKKTMRNLNTLHAFMSIIENRGWMVNLPRGAELAYNVFLDADTSTSTTDSPRHHKGLTNSALLQNRPIAKNIIDDLLS